MHRQCEGCPISKRNKTRKQVDGWMVANHCLPVLMPKLASGYCCGDLPGSYVLPLSCQSCFLSPGHSFLGHWSRVRRAKGQPVAPLLHCSCVKNSSVSKKKEKKRKGKNSLKKICNLCLMLISWYLIFIHQRNRSPAAYLPCLFKSVLSSRAQLYHKFGQKEKSKQKMNMEIRNLKLHAAAAESPKIKSRNFPWDMCHSHSWDMCHNHCVTLQ